MSFLDALKARVLVAPPAATLVPAPAPVPPARSVDGGSGLSGGFGDRGENRKSAPAPWPAGVDWHLTRSAARLSGLVAGGAEWRWCPAGGLDVVQEDDGRMWCLSPGTAARLRAERLLPDVVAETEG